jgi:hypothetical protein
VLPQQLFRLARGIVEALREGVGEFSIGSSVNRSQLLKNLSNAVEGERTRLLGIFSCRRGVLDLGESQITGRGYAGLVRLRVGLFGGGGMVEL